MFLNFNELLIFVVLIEYHIDPFYLMKSYILV